MCGGGSVLDFGFIIIIISPKCLLSQCIVFTRAAANDYFYCRLIYRLIFRLVECLLFSINLLFFPSVDEFFS